MVKLVKKTYLVQLFLKNLVFIFKNIINHIFSEKKKKNDKKRF